ncbi:MAG: ribosome recycling factor, partial [Clostridia bacterium]|nr:ribosome recycling factor [Clostridia bacterium]
RKELTKRVQKEGEDAKVAIRNIRRDAMDASKKMKKDGELTEDEQKDAEKAIQDVTDKYIKNVDAISAKKEKELMEI